MASVALLLFLAGCFLGSFLTVLAHRVPRGEGWVAGRSRCPECNAQITARDNVPVLSWVLLRGRCRACGERISARYPLTEVGLGALWAASYLILGDDNATELILGLVLCALLVTITLTDLDLRLIPNAVVLFGGIVGIAIAAIGEPGSLDTRAIAAVVAGGVLFLVVLLYPRGMGMGDVKLVAMMGIYLGRAVAPAVLVGFLLGAVVGLGMIARQGSAARKNAIPFGPFLACGGVIGLWFGEEIVDWYLDEFFPDG
jgi:leader peptidase (prepilin peptidase)/N-methyltransferase